MLKVLVTGSSGYIGKHLCQVLEREYVVGLDRRFEPQNADRFIQQDILDSKLIDDEYDAVVHLAALVNVGTSMKCPMEYYRNNITGTLNILEKVKCKNFIFASTGAAHEPTSPYALSKRLTEEIIKEYCTLNNIDYTIFRFYNVVGQAGYPPTNMDGLMYNLIKAKETGEFNLYGNDYNTKDGSAVRDYVHVLEICKAIQFALKRPSNFYVEALGSGEGYTVKQVIETFKRVNNCDFKVNELPRRAGDLECSVLNNVSAYMQKSFTLEEMMKL